MDLAQAYHTFAKQMYPSAIRIADRFLSCNALLKQVYWWKEAFIEWYDCSSTYELAKKGFERWLKIGNQIEHSAVQACLTTMNNWREEICN